MEKPRTAPAVEKKIRDVKAEDIRVRVTGNVAETGEGFFVLKDETGSLRVESAEAVTENKRVRVFGRPISEGSELSLAAEIIQDMSVLDEKLYKNIQSLNRTEDT